jgi:hydroxymethylpyrimidine pyrophosphatase-like HAD family hydrolase
VFRRQPLKQETLEVLVPWLKENADFPCTFFELESSYDIAFNESMYQYLSSISRLDQMPPVKDPVRALSHETYMISPYITADRDAEFLSHAPGMMSARWSPHFADMIRENGGKPEGIKAALALHGFTREEAIAFGDGGNDITMLAYAGIGVAMGNASDEVKAHSDYVTDSCENDGIYKAFKHFDLI